MTSIPDGAGARKSRPRREKTPAADPRSTTARGPRRARAGASGGATDTAAGGNASDGAKASGRRAKPKTTRKSASGSPDGLRRVVTVGSVLADTIAVADSGLIERAEFLRAGKTYMMVEEGRKYPAQSIAIHLGGGGANTAVCASRLGWRASTLAVIGEDPNGDTVLKRLLDEGVEVSAIRRNPDVATGVSLMITSDRPNAAILIFRGASETLRIDDIRDPNFEGADLVYISPLSSESADCFPALVEQGAWAGSMVAVNPGPRQLRSRGEAFLGALANVDLISVNADELSVLATTMTARGALKVEPAVEGDPPPEPNGKRLSGRRFGEGAQTAPLDETLAALHRLGPRYISVTDGAYGAYLSIAGEEETPARLLFQKPAPVDAVLGSAGAGDCYGSTLAISLVEGLAPEDAMRRAALNAAGVVGKRSTTEGLLTRAALGETLSDTELEPAEEIAEQA